ncbi:Hypothetical protein NTJ_14527 [Nesidiocoris tenuis]|uniref:IBB domain-containing protein n=1 Tax=Nesidiocoris tenuis TaxID=355587 RepID=A0ABN7BBE1_9HEMI|nr:Hypothetical protein NTJ_14527 [Nesidiocoris tenuis]
MSESVSEFEVVLEKTPRIRQERREFVKNASIRRGIQAKNAGSPVDQETSNRQELYASYSGVFQHFYAQIEDDFRFRIR